jgi:hypothetical protein
VGDTALLGAGVVVDRERIDEGARMVKTSIGFPASVRSWRRRVVIASASLVFIKSPIHPSLAAALRSARSLRPPTKTGMCGAAGLISSFGV